MDRTETLMILSTIKLAYPNSYKISKEELDQTAKLWLIHFKEYEFKLVTSALNTYIATDTTGFPPTIGQIKDIARRIVSPNQRTDEEIWIPIKNALKNGYYGSHEEYQKLPEDLRRCVTPDQIKDWSKADTDDLSFIRSEVIKEYRQQEQRKIEHELLPYEARRYLVEKTADKNISQAKADTVGE